MPSIVPISLPILEMTPCTKITLDTDFNSMMTFKVP